MQLAEKYDLPPFSLNRRFQRKQRPISQQFSFQPLPPDPPADEKRDRCTRHISQQGNKELLPESKEKPGADTQHAAREQEDVATRVK